MGNADSVLHMGMLPGKPLSPPSFDSSSSHPGASACSGTLGKDSGGLCLAQRRWAESIGWEGARDAVHSLQAQEGPQSQDGLGAHAKRW